MQGRLTKFRILFYCLLDGGQFIVSRCGARQEGGTVPVPSSCVSPQDRWEAVY